METDPTPITFGPFRLDRERRLLLSGDAPVALSSRAFDILELLVTHRDRVVGRDEILAHVWPGIVVEASNLTVQMSTLRRALGDTGGEARYIATVPGRGYRFIGGPASSEPRAEGVAAHPAPVPVAAAVGDPPPVVAPARDAAPAPTPMQGPARRWRLVALGVAVVVGAAALGALVLRPAPHDAAAPRLSIVVLPFRNLSDERGKDYLADAVSDDLTTELAHIPGSLVIARTTADSYKTHPATAAEIGRALNVRYLLEGSVRADGEALRLNAQLIDTRDGRHIWSDWFDASTAKLLTARTDIVHRVARALDVAMVREEAARSERERPNDPDALDLFFRARSLVNRSGTLADLSTAQGLLERAIIAQPDFVEALAALANVLMLKVQGFDYPAAPRDDARAAAVIDRALGLAPRDPEVLSVRGRYLSSEGRCAEAEAAFGAALEVAPAHLGALWGLAYCAWRRGELARVAPALEATLRLDPQGPAYDRRLRLLALATLFDGKPRDAVPLLLRAETADGAAAADPDNPSQAEMTRLYLIAATALAGDAAEARRRYAAYAARWPRRSIWRQEALLTPSQSGVPYFPRIKAALAEAGMPAAEPEDADYAVAAGGAPLALSDFGGTPRTLPGGRVLRTAELKALLAGPAKPLVLNVGRRHAVIPGSVLLEDGVLGQSRAEFAATPAGKATEAASMAVVMGTGPAETLGYNMALHLMALGYRNVVWYRGGEEAWAQGGGAAEDRRDP